MAKALSTDLRRRVVDASAQGMSCRQAAERLASSPACSLNQTRRTSGIPNDSISPESALGP